MKIFKNRKNLINEISNIRNIAFVPTMGSLHKGHISLINKARKKSSKVLVSIYVNREQFNSINDFKKYPRNLKKDIKVLKTIKIDYLYIPTRQDIHSFKPKSKIYLDSFSKILCGKFRPLHFKGVINIVNRFLEIIKPRFIYLGMKDFQQLILIKLSILQNNIKTKLIPCPTIRDKKGIALSSRNAKLNKSQLQIAGRVYKFIKNNKKYILKQILAKKRSRLLKHLVELGVRKIDYIECVDLNKKTLCNNVRNKFNVFIAYYVGDVRLIDNL